MFQLRKTVSLLYVLDVLLAVIWIAVWMRLFGEFRYPDYEEYVAFLLRLRMAAFFGLLVSVVATVAVSRLAKAVGEELTYLHGKIRELEKKTEVILTNNLK